MRCYTCDRDTPLVYRVQLRGDVRSMPAAATNSPEDPAYLSYKENTTFRSAFVCLACYTILDSFDGTGEIGDRVYGIAGRSRGGKAALYNEAEYKSFQQKQASELGIESD
jgi:hypothetical protein